jgi:hypothetical protein
MAHAAFGLLNSTPHSAMLPEAEMTGLLREMAAGALKLPPLVRPLRGPNHSGG